jgi:hypothetical protein
MLAGRVSRNENKNDAVDVLDGELPQAPRLLFQGLNDVHAQRLQFLVGRIDIGGKDPVNRSRKRRGRFAEEYHRVAAGHGANAVGIELADGKAEGIAIVPLRAFDIGNGQFRNWRTERGGFAGHRSFLDPHSTPIRGEVPR